MLHNYRLRQVVLPKIIPQLTNAEKPRQKYRGKERCDLRFLARGVPDQFNNSPGFA
jgi:hypothetical protein